MTKKGNDINMRDDKYINARNINDLHDIHNETFCNMKTDVDISISQLFRLLGKTELFYESVDNSSHEKFFDLIISALESLIGISECLAWNYRSWFKDHKQYQEMYKYFQEEKREKDHVYSAGTVDH